MDGRRQRAGGPVLHVRYPADTLAWVGIVVEVAAQVLRARGAHVYVEETRELNLDVDGIGPADSLAMAAVIDVHLDSGGAGGVQLLHDWWLVSAALRALLAAMGRYDRAVHN